MDTAAVARIQNSLNVSASFSHEASLGWKDLAALFSPCDANKRTPGAAVDATCANFESIDGTCSASTAETSLLAVRCTSDALRMLWDRGQARCRRITWVPIIKVPAATSSKGQHTHATLVSEQKRVAGECDWMKPQGKVADFLHEPRGGNLPRLKGLSLCEVGWASKVQHLLAERRSARPSFPFRCPQSPPKQRWSCLHDLWSRPS